MAATNDVGRGRRAPISAINITPLVDVMLVLLVIMMVSATYIVSQSLKVDLPKTATSDGSTPTVATVTINAEHEMFLNKEPVDDEQLVAALRTMYAENHELTVMVSAASAADHGDVVKVLDLARVEGISKFAVNVAPVRQG
jgi:biopolymer transport protein ExbD